MNYRKELDGLRAIAVLPVIFFHADFSFFSGGFVGVDVFFVISGYLITGIIYQEMYQGRFSIMRFYERRARRILPALFLVATASIPFAWLWMLPSEFKNFSESLIGVATFTSNILFWHESGYFAAAADLKPLLHTWSLAVEEQFYILYPPLLLAIYYLFPRKLVFFIGLGILVSLSLAHWASVSHATANFYLLPTRAWELGVGALLAVSLNRGELILARKLREATSLVGLGMIVYSILAFHESTPFPSLWALLPVIGTALIIFSADGDTLVGRILRLRALVGIGLISYSAYLWHQPLFAFARIRLLEGVSSEVYFILIVVTFLLAGLTWKTIEVPARKKLKLPRSQILLSAFSGCLALSAIGGYGYITQGVTVNNAVASELSAWEKDVSPKRSDCHSTPSREIINPSQACVMGPKNNEDFDDRRNIYVWGDSHGVELSYSLGEQFEDEKRSVFEFTTSQCIPIPEVDSEKESHCIDANKKTMAFLEKQEPGIIVLVARWPLYLVGQRVSHKNGCTEGTDFTGRWSDSAGPKSDRIRVLGRKINQTVKRLVGAGHKVVFVHAVPEPGCDVPNRLAKQVMFGGDRELKYRIDTHLKRINTLRRNIELVPGVNKAIVDPTDLFCDLDKKHCFARDDEGVFYFDTNHPSVYASAKIAARIGGTIRERGW